MVFLRLLEPGLQFKPIWRSAVWGYGPEPDWWTHCVDLPEMKLHRWNWYWDA